MSTGQGTAEKAASAKPEQVGIRVLKLWLDLLHAADCMAIEGTSRARASEIVERAKTDSGTDTSASIAGQIFSAFGIRTATSHGRSKLVLEHNQLAELKQKVTDQIRAESASLKAIIASYDGLTSKVQDLEKQVKGIVQLQLREQELNRVMVQNRDKVAKFNDLQYHAERLKQQAARVDALEKECSELSQKLKTLPSLEQKKQALEARIAKHAATWKDLAAKGTELADKERDLASKEQALATRIAKIGERQSFVNLAAVQQAIEAAKVELDQLSKQLGEKRSLFDRMLGRNRPGSVS